MLKFIERHFAITISSSVLIGMVLGYFIETGETYRNFMSNYMIVWLFILMTITSLKIDLDDLKKNFKKINWIAILVLSKLILFPFLVFVFTDFLPTSYRVGLVLLSALPSSTSSVGLLIPLRGNLARALVVSVISNLIAPFVLPFVLLYTIGTYVELDILSMFILVFSTTVIPFLLSLLMKRFSPKMVKPLASNATPIISIGLVVYLVVLLIHYSDNILSDPRIALYSALVAFSYFFLVHLYSVLISIKENKSNMVTHIFSLAYLNLGLGIVIGLEYFDTATLLIILIYHFNVVSLIPLQMIFAKNRSLEYNSPAN